MVASFDSITYNITGAVAAIASTVAVIRSRTANQKANKANTRLDHKLEDCESAKDTLRHSLQTTQADRDRLAIENSALKTENVMLARLLPGGDIAKRLNIEWPHK